jgi:hypothetical protein
MQKFADTLLDLWVILVVWAVIAQIVLMAVAQEKNWLINSVNLIPVLCMGFIISVPVIMFHKDATEIEQEIFSNDRNDDPD